MKPNLLVAIAATLVCFGCDRSVEKKTSDLAETRQKAAENMVAARGEAADKSAKAYVEAEEKVGKEQANVDKQAVEVARSIETERVDLKTHMEEQLGKIDKRMIDLNTKIATSKTTKSPRQELEVSLRGLQSKSATLRKNVDGVRTATEVSLGATKVDFDAALVQIEKSLDELERKV